MQRVCDPNTHWVHYFRPLSSFIQTQTLGMRFIKKTAFVSSDPGTWKYTIKLKLAPSRNLTKVSNLIVGKRVLKSAVFFLKLHFVFDGTAQKPLSSFETLIGTIVPAQDLAPYRAPRVTPHQSCVVVTML